MLPRLLERAGPGATGSITGLYTVLVEGDDMQEPIGDTARSILDGHIVLYPAARDRGALPEHRRARVDLPRRHRGHHARSSAATPTELRRLLAAHRDVRELVEIGAYAAGSTPDADRAIALLPRINDFLRQAVEEPTPAADTWRMLHDLVGAA